MQTQTIGHAVHYKGVFDCMRSIFRKEGARVFYRGIIPPILGIGAVNSILFGTYGSLRRCLQSDPNAPLTLSQVMICGTRDVL
jgi:solute carrier family 25 carnitine/acylcarnitine transporter 20/29